MYQGSNLTIFDRCQPGTEVQTSGAPSKILLAGYNYEGLKPYFFAQRQLGSEVQKSLCPTEISVPLSASGTRTPVISSPECSIIQENIAPIDPF